MPATDRHPPAAAGDDLGDLVEVDQELLVAADQRRALLQDLEAQFGRPLPLVADDMHTGEVEAPATRMPDATRAADRRP